MSSVHTAVMSKNVQMQTPCACLNVKHFIYRIFGKKEKEEKKLLSAMMPPTRVYDKRSMSQGGGRG